MVIPFCVFFQGFGIYHSLSKKTCWFCFLATESFTVVHFRKCFKTLYCEKGLIIGLTRKDVRGKLAALNRKMKIE